MVDFTFDGMFRTTNKGIPDTASLPSHTYLNSSFYTNSMALQTFLALVFILFFVASVYRSIKKLKNRKFIMVSHDNNEDDDKEKDNESEKGQKTATNDQLIYKFDDEDHDKEKIDDARSEDLGKNNDDDYENEDDDDDEPDENETKFHQLDHKILHFQPILIVPIVINSVFTLDILGLGLLITCLLVFAIFNLKGVGSNYRILSSIYLVPAILGFFSFFINDLDLST